MNREESGIGVGLTLVLTVATGLTVANLYYNQPMLALMAADLGIGADAVSGVPVLTQIGYALALLLLVPLGDIVEQRAFIVCTSVASALSLLLMSRVHSAAALSAVSLAIGFSSVGTQLMVPLAARLAGPHRRGTVVGTVMTGLLIGILGARLLAGQGAEWFGWRGVYLRAAVGMLVVAAVLWRALPTSPPHAMVRYGALLASLGALFREEPVLREATLTGGCAFAAFSAFWSTESFFLATDYHYGSAAAGGLGLAGIVGALGASVAGRLSDGGHARRGVWFGLLCAWFSYVLLMISGRVLWGLVAGVVFMDLGVHATMVSNQTRFYALRPEAPNRVNTVYMVGYFAGGAIGSAAGTFGWQHAGWMGVCVVGLVVLSVALACMWIRSPEAVQSRGE